MAYYTDEDRNSDDTNSLCDNDEAWAIYKYLQVTEHNSDTNNDFIENEDFYDDF